MKILIAYDGSLNSQIALRYGLRKIRDKGGSLTALHVFNATLFVDYDALPGAKETARSESRKYVEDAKKIISEFDGGASAKVLMEEGDPEEEILKRADSAGVDLIISPPRYKSLSKIAPCPVSIIPGYILVPLDNYRNFEKISSLVLREAQESSSKVLLLGIVPIHLYSSWEKEEVRRVQKETSEALKKARKELRESGIETEDFIRSGYPDEEIAKIAVQFPIAMIIIPGTGDAPSELGKAAAMLIEDSDRLKNPIVFAPTETAG